MLLKSLKKRIFGQFDSYLLRVSYNNKTGDFISWQN